MCISENGSVETAVIEGPVEPSTVSWPSDCGAEAVFLGRTRVESHPQFGRLVLLEYEVYEPMAVQLLAKMARDAVYRFGCRAVRIVHAKGRVEPGQASIVIQVATPHRIQAFEACRYLIDRLKHELPIWKLEIWERGRTHVTGCCAHHPDGEMESDSETSMKYRT